MRKLIIGMAAGALIAPALPAIAQRPREQTNNALVEAVVKCRGESDDAARLRCFDAATTALAEATQRGAIVVVDREDVRKTRRSLFGFSLPKLPFFSGDDSVEEAPQEIEATIKSVRAVGYQKYVIELDSGARWQTTEPNPRPPEPRAGEKIKIKRGVMGAYFLSVGERRALKGMRIG